MSESLQVVREHVDKHNLASYIRLEGRSHGKYEYSDLLVKMLVGDYGLNWQNSHKVLHPRDSFMINPRQFWDFRDLIESGKAYDGNGSKVPITVLKAVKDEIFGIKDPWRAEWLNAKFELIDEKWQINYDYGVVDGKLKPSVSEPLEDCLMQDSYINPRKINRHGMPTEQSRDREVYYLCPRDDAVAWFFAGSDGAVLICYRILQNSDSGCGVRQAKIFRGK